MHVTRSFRWLAASALLVTLAAPGCGRVSFQTVSHPLPSPSPSHVMDDRSGPPSKSPESNDSDSDTGTPTPAPTASTSSGGGGGSQSRYGTLRIFLQQSLEGFSVSGLRSELLQSARLTVSKEGSSPQVQTVGPEVLLQEQPEVNFSHVPAGDVNVTAEALGSEGEVLGTVSTVTRINAGKRTDLEVVLELDNPDSLFGSVTADVNLTESIPNN